MPALTAVMAVESLCRISELVFTTAVDVQQACFDYRKAC